MRISDIVLFLLYKQRVHIYCDLSNIVFPLQCLPSACIRAGANVFLRSRAVSVLFTAFAYAIDQLWPLCGRAWRHCSVSGVAGCGRVRACHDTLLCFRVSSAMPSKVMSSVIAQFQINAD